MTCHVVNEHHQYSQSLAIEHVTTATASHWQSLALRRRDGSHWQLHRGKACDTPGGQELSVLWLDAGIVGSCSLLSFSLVLQ